MLYRLIDWLIRLPEELMVEFRRELIEYEEQQRMPYITSIERLGREEGRQEGQREGRREGLREGLITARQRAVLDALEVRFGSVPDALRQSIESVQDEARLRTLHRVAIRAVSLDDFTASI